MYMYVHQDVYFNDDVSRGINSPMGRKRRERKEWGGMTRTMVDGNEIE